MGSGVGKPVVNPSAAPAYTFCYTAPGGPFPSPSPSPGTGSRRGEAGGTANPVESGGEDRRLSTRLSNYMYGEAVDEGCNMVCEACSASFTLFKRKFRCTDCDKYYCSSCFTKDPRKCCRTCKAVSLNPNRADLMALKIKDLRLYLTSHSVSTHSCTEKDDLVNLILQYVRSHPSPPSRSNAGRATTSSSSADRRSVPSSQGPSPGQSAGQRTTQRLEDMFNNIFSRIPNQGSESSVDPPTFHNAELFFAPTNRHGGDVTDNTSTPPTSGENQRPHSRQAWASQPPSQPSTTAAPSSTATATHDEPTPPPPHEAEQTPIQPMRRRASLSEVEDADGIDSLSIKQLKEILVANFVDFKGCVERWELQERVRRLYEERQQRKRKEDKSKDANKEGTNVLDDDDESALCKICMDAEIDCVLLECGHMVTCTSCGKRMNECPICRQYVIRAVHIFRA